MTEVDVQGEISRELGSGEVLLWTGRPQAGVLFRPLDVFFIPFGLMWLAISLAGVFGGHSKTPGDPPPLLVFVPFVLIGLYITAGRFWIDIWQRRRTIYGLTNQRVIILRGVFGRELKSTNLGTMSDLSVSTRKDRRGTIRFGANDLSWYATGMEIWMPGIGGGNSFERIENAKQVYEKIRLAQRSASATVASSEPRT